MSVLYQIEELANGKKDLPTLPGVAMRILDVLRDDTSEYTDIGDVIATDPPLTAKILKIVNSPYYGFTDTITSVHKAVGLLGINVIKNLALSFSLVSAYNTHNGDRFNYSLFWKNSLTSAIASRLMAEKILPAVKDDAFILGLIHDIGILALLKCFSEQYDRVLDYQKKESCSYEEAENQILECNHMEMGEYLVKSWGLPESFTIPIRYHHHPIGLRHSNATIKGLTKILHLASLFSDFYNRTNKTFYYSLFEWYLKEYGYGDLIGLENIYEEVSEQAKTVFPLFEINLDTKASYMEIVERARKDLINPSSVQNKAAEIVSDQIKIPSKRTDQKNKKKILIVDDEDRNITLLKAMLMSEDHQISGVTSGEDALRKIHEDPPHIILLDVMMPGIGGFDLCERLKQGEKTQFIPILMVTALNKKEHRLKAMEVGADDFLSKPVDRTELLFRVRSLLKSKAYHDQLMESNQEIRQKNEQLKELEKIKEGLTHMIAHDMKNPLSGISGNLQILLFDKETLDDSQICRLKKSLDFSSELNEMIQSLLDVHKMESGKMDLQKDLVEMPKLLNEVLEQFSAHLENKSITLETNFNSVINDIEVDHSIIKRVVANLVSNAVRQTPKGGRIDLQLKTVLDDQYVCISVKDTGVGIQKDDLEKIFDKFKQIQVKDKKSTVGSCGLGLTFCKLAVEAHGGKIWAESEGEDKGSTFHFYLPVSSSS